MSETNEIDAFDDADADGDADRTWPALRETTLAEIEVRVAELDEQSAGDDVLLWMDRLTAYSASVKRVRDAVYALACAWITANGPLRLNEHVVFSVGHQRMVKCLDVRQTLHDALTALDGDLDAVAQLLAWNAWKHGACRTALPSDVFDRLFITEIRSKVVPGKPEPMRLIRLDERYTNRR